MKESNFIILLILTQTLNAIITENLIKSKGCDCSWTNTPGACNHDDGSICQKKCCKTPTPEQDCKGCDCSWATPSTCGYDDGSICHKCCCNKPVPPIPHHSNKNTPMSIISDGTGGNPSMLGINGFTGSGYQRMRSTNKYNLLNGGISFTIDISNVKNLVNSNLYFIIPGTLGNNGYYCDNGGSAATCIELDIYESNGNQLIASTMHTKLGKGIGGCDTWGCRTITYLNRPIQGNMPFDVDVTFSENGDMTIILSQNGNSLTVFNALESKDISAASDIADGMKNHGAVVVTGMWTGWVPPNTSGMGDLNGSSMKITNLKYTGQDLGGVNLENSKIK